MTHYRTEMLTATELEEREATKKARHQRLLEKIDEDIISLGLQETLARVVEDPVLYRRIAWRK